MSVARTPAVVAGVLLVLALLWVGGMRDKGSTVVRAQRRFNRDHMNPRQRGLAGTAGVTTALVRHTGRRSGRTYETPVDVVPTAGGFVVSMVYGPDTDWVRNIRAGGSAAVVHDGTEPTRSTSEACLAAASSECKTAKHA